jgi:para-aminobenzoate synthetase / 4-amino-4-deoxychorismate lyase
MTRAILDFPDGTGAARRLRFHAPRRVITTTSTAGVRAALRDVEAATRDAGAWAVGYVAYEAAPAFDRALVTRAPVPDLPLLWFGIFDPPDVADDADGADADGATTAAVGAGSPPGSAPHHAAGPGALSWSTATERAAYDDAIAAIREGIAAGDVYQVNHTLRFRAACNVDPLALYDSLVAARHGLYHAFVETSRWAVISASPELFLDIRDGTITTRPMKGTMRRGRWLDEDADATRRLAHSEKDRAENLMIVDLLRNDLGRIAEFGSVAVPRIFDIETYPTVHQMTSTVTARLREDVHLDDVFAATFPCGSVTGAPKVTAMRAIATLEDEPRGVYCGAVGVVRPDGSATFNVPIRTLLLDRRDGTAVFGAGGGITWDSHADAEYDEVVAKATLVTEDIPPFDLIETMRLDDGVFARLPLHLQRLDESARYWAFHADTARNAAAALEAVRRQATTGRWRVRLTAAADGTVNVTRTALDGPAAGLLPPRSVAPATGPGTALPRTAAAARSAVPVPLPVALADAPVSRHDRLLSHKTTARHTYEQARAGHPHAFDVLLHNEDGWITEFTRGNVVADIDGELLTPPREAGLLPGTLRAELLAAVTVREAVLALDDLRRARALWFINSVRGWVPVSLEAAAGGEAAGGEAAGGEAAGSDAAGSDAAGCDAACSRRSSR